jgi:hypothetical protein
LSEMKDDENILYKRGGCAVVNEDKFARTLFCAGLWKRRNGREWKRRGGCVRTAPDIDTRGCRGG